MPLRHFQKVEQFFVGCLVCHCVGYFFLHLMTLLAHLRAAEDLNRPEQSKLSPEVAPHCPSIQARGIRTLTTNGNRFSRAFALKPLTPLNTKKNNKKHFQPFLPLSSCKNTPFLLSSTSILVLQHSQLVKKQLRKEKKREKQKRSVAAGVDFSRTADASLEGKLTESGKRKARGGVTRGEQAGLKIPRSRCPGGRCGNRGGAQSQRGLYRDRE